MKNTISFAIIILTLGMFNLSAFADNPYTGYWALTIPGGGPGWLGVTQEDENLQAGILWGGGSVKPVSSIKVEGEQLVIKRVQVERRGPNKGKKITETITAMRSGETLSLVTVKAGPDGKEYGKAEFSGKRIPPLPAKPDLSKAKYGKPITLFNGKNLDGWELTNPNNANGWIAEDGVLVNKPVQPEGKGHIAYGNLRTTAEFEDFNLKLEANVPEKSNSGIYLRGIYELQILDSYGKPPSPHNMGAIYSRIAPSVSAEKPAGQWQTMDITLLDRHVTVVLNGKTIIDNEPLLGCTGGALWSDPMKPGPMYLQGNHGASSFRNIVLTPIIKKKTRDASKMDWWLDSKFGLFIHWGPSSIAGVEISWARQTHPFDHDGNLEKIPDEVYDALYKQFNPVDFDADFIVRTAKEAGMKYIVFTAKHHDGFANWHTNLSDYNIANTPFKRDICKELAEAVHKHGLKLGWYYSTRDWYHQDYLVGDNSKYNDFYHGQIRELLTNYGKVDVLWFDHVAGSWSNYRFEDLFDMVYDLQPDIIVNNRAAKFIKRGKHTGTPTPEIAALTRGDYDTPEGKVGVFRKEFPWETCMPMSKGPDGGGGWSYRPDAITASFEKCAQMLAASVTGCGNMLLNVGPMASGALRPEELENLRKFKPWMQIYGESIYGTEGGPYISGQWGGACVKGNTIYLHIFQWVDNKLVLPALPREVLHCEELGGESVACAQTDTALALNIEGGKERSAHSVVKLTLAEGPDIPLLPVGGQASTEQHKTLVNPMGR